MAEFLSHLGKWVILIKFEAENEFFCTWKVEKPQSTTSTLSRCSIFKPCFIGAQCASAKGWRLFISRVLSHVVSVLILSNLECLAFCACEMPCVVCSCLVSDEFKRLCKNFCTLRAKEVHLTQICILIKFGLILRF